MLHNDPSGANAIGALGSGLAIGGIQNGLAIEFDTYNSSAGQLIEPARPRHRQRPHQFPRHRQLLRHHALGPPQYRGRPACITSIVTWNATTQTLSYTFDGQPAGTLLTSNIATQFLGGSDFAYFGFGAGTGGLSNTQSVHVTNISATFEGQTLAAAPAGVAGEPINLGLAAPLAAEGTSFTVDVAGLSSGWALNGGTELQNGIWTTRTTDLRSLAVTSPQDFIGATALSIMASWTGSDGVALATTINDNIEVFQPGSPIFAWAGEDHLTGSSGQDLFVFAQPIQHDTVYSFDPQLDQMDLTGFTGFSSFADLQNQITADSAGNSLITLGDGQTITLEGVPLAELTSGNFMFDVTPQLDNANTMTIGNGAMLPLSGIINNAGVIELGSNGNETLLQVIQHGITLEGGGQVILSDSDQNVISGTLSDVSLHNIDNTISGAGQLGFGQMTLINEGTIIATGDHPLVIDSGSNPIVNSGTLEAGSDGSLIVDSAVKNSGLIWANGGTLTLNGEVTGSGTAFMSGNSVLEFASAASTNVALAADAVGKLILDDTLHFNGSVTGFDANDQLDLTHVAFVNGGGLSFSANESNTGGTLSVSNGLQSASILFDGQYDPSGFQVATDASGGTVVTYSSPAAVATASASSEPVTTATIAPTAAASTGPALNDTVTASSTGASVMDTSSVATTASTSAQPTTATTASVATDPTVPTSTNSSLTDTITAASADDHGSTADTGADSTVEIAHIDSAVALKADDFNAMA